MKNTAKFFATVVLAISVAFVGCNKEQDNQGQNNQEEPSNSDIPVVVTSEVTEITNVSAICSGEVTSDGGNAIVTRGFCWSTSDNPTLDDDILFVDAEDPFVGTITRLQPFTTYYIRAFAINGNGVGYGTALSFVTDGAMAPSIMLIETDNYLVNGQLVDVGVEYEYGFYMESTVGLSYLTIRALDSNGYYLYYFDKVELSGLSDYTYVGTVSFDREIVGECTFTATVTDVYDQSSTASFTVYINQEQMLIPYSFEWNRHGANPGTGLEEFGLYWDFNGKDAYARIRPLEGVCLFYFDPTVWNEVNTQTEKAALFSSALETQPCLYEYANVNVWYSGYYDDVIGTILPNGTMRLIHVTYCMVYSFKGIDVSIIGEWK